MPRGRILRLKTKELAPIYCCKPRHSSDNRHNERSKADKSMVLPMILTFFKAGRFLIQLQINFFTLAASKCQKALNLHSSELALTLNPTFSFTSDGSESGIPTSMQVLSKELIVRRQRIMDLRQSIDDMRLQNEDLNQRLKSASDERDTAIRMRDKVRVSLTSIDKQFIDLRNDVITLREIEAKYRDLLVQHEDLQTKLEKTQPADDKGKSEHEKNLLKNELDARAQELCRLEKRIERLRNQSPCMVSLLSVIQSVEKAADQTSFHRDGLADDLTRVQSKYSKLLREEFPQHSLEIGARELLAKACSEYIRSSFFHAAFDCVVECPRGIDSRLLALIENDYPTFQILRHSNTSLEVVCPEKHTGVGPYGIFSCFNLAFPKEPHPLRVYPTLSTQTINKSENIRIVHDTCKSSKPGGQASNVTETQVKSSLIFNGRVLARASSQDTRSQHENRKRSERRLLESLHHELDTMRSSPPRVQRVVLKAESISDIHFLFETREFKTDLFIQSALSLQ